MLFRSQLTLRGSEQYINQETYETDYYPVKIVVRGKATTTTLGKLVRGKKGEPEIELEVYYLKVDINDSTWIELDKLNFKFNLNGKDMMKKIRSQI